MIWPVNSIYTEAAVYTHPLRYPFLFTKIIILNQIGTYKMKNVMQAPKFVKNRAIYYWPVIRVLSSI